MTVLHTLVKTCDNESLFLKYIEKYKLIIVAHYLEAALTDDMLQIQKANHYFSNTNKLLTMHSSLQLPV